MANYGPLAGFVSGFGTGYNFTRENQRRDELEKQEKEKYATEKAARARDTEWQAGRERLRTDMTTTPVYQDVEGQQVEIGRRPKEMGFKDNLKLVEDMAAHDFKYGKMPLMDYAAAKDRVKLMKAEGMLDAHQAFVETGDIRKAAAKFNEAGDEKVDVDSLKAREIDGPFGKQVVYSGKTAEGHDFEYDPVRAAALAGGAKGYLAMEEAKQKAGTEKDKVAVAREQARAHQTSADAAQARSDAMQSRSDAMDAHFLRQDKLLERKLDGTQAFSFKPADQARVAIQVSNRMKVEDPMGKKVDHEATTDAIQLAGDIMRRTNGQVGLDEAIGLVGNPSMWLSKKEAEDQARKDYGKVSNTFGGVEVKGPDGKVGKKLSKEEYLKQRSQELITENRQGMRDRIDSYIGRAGGVTPKTVAARGLPAAGAPAAAPKGGRGLSPAAQSVLNDALQ